MPFDPAQMTDDAERGASQMDQFRPFARTTTERRPRRRGAMIIALAVCSLLAPSPAFAERSGAVITINGPVPLDCRFGPAIPSGALLLAKGRSLRLGAFFGCNTSKVNVPVRLTPANGRLQLDATNYAAYGLVLTWQSSPGAAKETLFETQTLTSSTATVSAAPIKIDGYQGLVELIVTVADTSNVKAVGSYTETITLTIG